jgi:hypothetical protein
MCKSSKEIMAPKPFGSFTFSVTFSLPLCICLSVGDQAVLYMLYQLIRRTGSSLVLKAWLRILATFSYRAFSLIAKGIK